MNNSGSRRRTLVTGAAVAVGGALGGALVATALTASASTSALTLSATSPTSSSPSSSSNSADPGGPCPAGARGGLPLTGTVTAVGSNSVTIKTSGGAVTTYTLNSSSDIDKNGEWCIA